MFFVNTSRINHTQMIKTIDDKECRTRTNIHHKGVSPVRIAEKDAIVAVMAPAQEAKNPFPVTSKGPRNVARHAMTIQQAARFMRAMV